MTPLYFAHLSQLHVQTEQLLEEHQFDQMLIGSGGLHKHFLDDTRYPFRPNPHFVHWAPFLTQHPDCWLLVRPNKKPLMFYYTPKDFWHLTPDLPAADWAKGFEWVAYDNVSAILSVVAQFNTAVISEAAFIGETALDQKPFSHNPNGLIQSINFNRAVKTEWEQHCLREANYLAVKGHRAALQGFESGLSEYEIHQAYLSAVQHNERDLPYDNIVGLNEHAAVLHYQFQQHSAPSQHRTLLIDAGARFNGYAADITRTFTQPGSLFADLVRGLDDLQLQLCHQISAGSHFVALHEQMHLMIADLLNRFGIVTANPEEQLEQGITRAFYPHGLGHLLGLQVHDVGGWQQDATGRIKQPPAEHPFLRLTRTLETGYVITVEPGIYFIPQLLAELKASPAASQINWALIEQLLPYGGIRIEDNLCVSKDGSENYTRDGFAKLA
ncbi:Xaa-Pro dipeptidase [Oceanospirillum maris]|uniref:Xaa-Pro dipeptidase n=1 Tax=Oceanospirillum maris TaxID=64977 RepID=UPI0004132032|nr:Xaa-Pro dipeptidase [Oceanospirillum maris]